MSFMFSPHPYDDPAAINYPALSEEAVSSLMVGAVKISAAITKAVSSCKAPLILLDGYPSADFTPITNLCSGGLLDGKLSCRVIDIAGCYKASEDIEKLLEPYLPEDREKDPVLLFGRRVDSGFDLVFDGEKLKALIAELRGRNGPVIVFGVGSLYSRELREMADLRVYFDVAPKTAILRARNGGMKNLGDSGARPFRAMLRRAYYLDFDCALSLRRELLRVDCLDYYIDSTDMAKYKMLPKASFSELTYQLSRRPLRSKPVYLEGVWGGQYVKKVRKIPDSMKNVAWVFDFIPMEVSVVSSVGGELFEMPFYTLLQSREEAIMGRSCAEKFGGYFPIRFNYDDTFHSSGNMSIQVHSGAKYNRENFNELGRQDESYYIVAASHGARTYLGFEDGADPQEFLTQAKQSEREHTKLDYLKYIHHVDSKPGVQLLIPAGTVHASGRNQLILEVGSLTVGSYTYKLYDYLRSDLDGAPRPIHSYHGERVLETSRNASWISRNAVQPPRILREGDSWRETVIGEHELLYFSLRHLEFEKEIRDDTCGRFHVLSLVDGERVRVRSLEHPESSFILNYLDIVLVPASLGGYVAENLGNQPCILHKTCLKDNFENDSL